MASIKQKLLDELEANLPDDEDSDFVYTPPSPAPTEVN